MVGKIISWTAIAAVKFVSIAMTGYMAMVIGDS